MISYREAHRLFRYDPETGALCRKLALCNRVKIGDAVGWRQNGYLYVSIGGRNEAVHRIAWLMINKRWPVAEIDHINQVRDDNRIINLREVTRSENLKNTKLRANNKSGCLGVNWDKDSRKWKVRVVRDKKRICLGKYREWWDAVCVRKSAENKYCYSPNHGRK